MNYHFREKTASVWALWRVETSHLLIFRHGEEQASVQLGVVLGQWLMPVVVDELHHREKSKRFWEAILPPAVKNLDQFVIASFPGINKTRLWSLLVSVRNSSSLWCISNEWHSSTPTTNYACPIRYHTNHRLVWGGAHLRVKVYSPCTLLDASRTRNVPSGVSLNFSFTSSLKPRASNRDSSYTEMCDYLDYNCISKYVSDLPWNVSPVPFSFTQ